MMLPLIIIIISLPQFISSTNLTLTYDAANSTCTATCSTCSDTGNTDTTTSNSNTAIIEELLNTTFNATSQELGKISQKMDGLIASLSCIKDTTTTNAGAINDILLLVEDLLMLHNESSSASFSPLPTSCQEIKDKQLNSPSGVYLLTTASSNGTKYVYCNMEELCGSGGGWTRLAYLDMTDSTQNCPSGFRLYQSGGVRACGRATSNGGNCTSIQFPSNGISYSQVCGRVEGYQYRAPDAVYPGDYTSEEYGSVITQSHTDINSYYVDGVSITCGSPRQHVWTLMAGLSTAGVTSWNDDARTICPCSPDSPQKSTLQSFIGNDYFCESGNPATDGSYKDTFYSSDPLWDGKDCSSEGDCCTAPGLPWFHKVLNTTTTDYLELRVCGDEGTADEDTPVSFYELYIK